MPSVSEPWTDEGLDAIHAASLRLLERAGVRVDSQWARNVLLAVGCSQGPQGRLLIPEKVVVTALAACPPAYTMTARNPGRSLPVDSHPGATFVHNLGGARDVIDPVSGSRRRALLRDQLQISRVMHHLKNQHMLVPLVQPGDVPDVLEPLYSYLVLARETDKFIGGPGISFPFQARYLREMSIAVTGTDVSEGSYPLELAFSPVSPLAFGEHVADALVETARTNNVVVKIIPCPAAGTTAPAALSAAIAQQNAEILAAVVLVQTVAPGTPVCCGPRLSAVDPRTGRVVSGTPETGVASTAAVLLARRYGLACDCYGPTSDSKVIDAQFGWEHALNAYLGLMARPRFLSGLGEMQAGAATALEVLVLDDEILNYCFYALEQRPCDAAALDVDAMVEGVLSSSGFLGTKHTRRYMRSDLCAPLLSFRGGMEEWTASGHHSVVDTARERIAEILAQEPVGLPDDINDELCHLIDRAAVEVGLSEWPEPRGLFELAGV